MASMNEQTYPSADLGTQGPITKTTSSSASETKKPYEKESSSHDVEAMASPELGEIEEILESDYTEEEYTKIKKKIDRYLLPLMWFCYGIQQTDKTSISTQALFGMREDLGMVGQQYQWLTTIFYLTYLIGEFPSNFLLQRWSLGRCLSIYMFCWGTCLICISAVNNWSQIMALRALQGFFECTISPGFLLIIGTWYKTKEQASRALFFQSANAAFLIICDLVMYGINLHAQKYGGIEAWRRISLFLGSLTLAAAVACFFLLGSPKEVRWLNKAEKRIVAARIVGNKAGRDTTGTKWDWSQVKDAFCDPQLYFSTLNAFINNIPNGGLTSFGSLMYASFGFDRLEVLLISIPRSCVSLCLFLAIGIYIGKVKNRRMFFMMAGCVTPFVGLLVMSLFPNSPEYKWMKWGMYLITMPFVFPIFLAWSLIPSNVAGRTKKTIVSSMTFLGYCVGNMAGAQVFRTEDGPRYFMGTIVCSVCFAIEFFLIVAWRGYYVWQNKRRDRAAAASGLSKEDQEREGREMGEADVTDLHNPHFRYTM